MPYEKLNSPTRVKKLSVSWKSKRVDWHHVSGGYFFLLYHFSPHLIRRPSHTEQILFIYACFIYFIPRALSVFSTELNCCLHFPLAFAGLVGGDCHKGWRWRGGVTTRESLKLQQFRRGGRGLDAAVFNCFIQYTWEMLNVSIFWGLFLQALETKLKLGSDSLKSVVSAQVRGTSKVRCLFGGVNWTSYLGTLNSKF